MDPVTLLFSGLAVLLVGAVWVLDRRLQRIELGLERLDELDALTTRVGAMATELDRKEASGRVAARLDEVAEAERRLVAALGDVTRQVAELRRNSERHERSTPVEGPRDLSAVVGEHLADQGFERIHVVTDVAGLEGGSGRVVFEAHRGQVMHKGHVRLSEGRVVDSQARAAYTAFP